MGENYDRIAKGHIISGNYRLSLSCFCPVGATVEEGKTTKQLLVSKVVGVLLQLDPIYIYRQGDKIYWRFLLLRELEVGLE